MILTREQEAMHQATLRAAIGEHFGIALVALVESDYEKAKNRFVDAPREDLLGIQGEARSFKRILKYLKERPVATSKV
jgi:hypothetical protein